ncbi:MAG TPA: glycosyltransferase family 4 protein [archaeon]|nr:glycosyltransferase family 4 protein [archaeon]
MKVIFTCPRTPRLYSTGLENLTLNLAKELAKLGVEAEIYTTSPEPENSTVNGIRVKEFSAWAPNESYYLSLPLFLALKKSDADIIQLNGYNNLVSFSGLFAKKASQKLVFYPCSSGANSFPAKMFRKIFDLIVYLFSPKIDFVLFLGEDEKKMYGKIFGNTRSEIIYPGINPEELQKSRAKPEKYRLLCAGRLVKNKGYSNLIPAFAKVSEKKPGAKLVIVGDGPERENLRRLTKSPGVGKNITFMGGLSRKEYVKELRKASVFILLLGFRNVSTVVMEALEMGLPVITTADSVPEFVEKKYVVGIQNPEDARETASVILKVLENPGKFAAKKPETLSWKESAKRHLEIYRKILPEELGGRRPH